MDEFQRIVSIFLKSLAQKGDFKPGSLNQNYLWIIDNSGLINSDICHYELKYYSGANNQPSKIAIEVHFVDKDHYHKFDRFKENLPNIEDMASKPSDLYKYKVRGYEREYIIVGKKYDCNTTNLVDELVKQLYYVDNKIGNDLRAKIKSIIFSCSN